MKKRGIINILAVLCFALALAPGLFQPVLASGGPDDGGYIYEDSNEAGGPAYAWEEISTTGTAVTLANNAVSAAIPLGFTFHFYGTDYTQVYISSNGFLSFLSGQPHGSAPAAIPAAATPNAIIAGYWADLNPSASGASVTYLTTGAEPNRTFIVEFNAVPHNASSNAVTFQFKLFEGSNDIEVHYNTISIDGSTHTLGIENAAGAIGLQYYNGTDEIASAMAVRYSLFTGVALRPSYEILYDEPGSTITFTQRIANWTGGDTTFAYTIGGSGEDWNSNLILGSKDFTTVAMANGESQYFTVEVEIPNGATPGQYRQVDLTVSGGGYEDHSTLIAAVPRRGYGLGYFDIPDTTDSAAGIVQMDTKFHNSIHTPANVDELGAYINYGAISPDGEKLWVAESGPANMAYVIDVDDLNQDPPVLTYTSIATGSEASDVAFTPDGKTAVISSFGAGNVQLVDTSTYEVSSTLTTGSNALKTTIGACFPRKAYVTNRGANTVSAVNLLTGAVTKITGFSQPHGVVVSPITHYAYVSNTGSEAIKVIDTLTDTVFATWDIDGSDMANLGISPDGTKLFVTSNDSVKVVNASTGSVIATIASPIDQLWDIEVFPAGMGPYAYVTSSNLNYSTIVVINTETYQVEKTIEDAWGVMGLALFPYPNECGVAPVASFTPVDGIAQVNRPFSWTNTTVYGATSYQWDFGDGSTSDKEHPTHTYTTPGTYTVTLTATNAHGSNTATGTVNFKPEAIFAPQNSVIYAGDTVQFTNTSTGSEPLSYLWDFGDGTATSTEKEPGHTYATVGDYTVTLTVTNAHGSHAAQGKVDFAPAASFTPLDTVASPGDAVTFTNTSTGTNTTANPLTYVWDFGDGTATSTETSPTHTFEGTQDVTVTLTAHNGYGTDGAATGTVKFKPKAQFSASSTEIAVGDEVEFTDTSIGPGSFTYLWDFGDGTATSTSKNPKHTYQTEGLHTVTLTVTNSNGAGSVTGTIKVFTKPTAAFTPSASVIHVNDTVTFTNATTGTEPISYVWDFGDGTATSTEKNPAHQYTAAGNYTVKLTATNLAGSHSVTGEIHFFAEPAFEPTSSIIQTGDSITFTNKTTGSTPLTYIWDFGDGTATSTAANPTHTYTTAGTYTVTLTADNAYGPEKSVTGTVVFKPRAKFTPLDSVIQVGDAVSFTNQSTGTGELTYLWDFGDGSPTSTATHPSHTYTKAGTYTVTLTTTSATYGSHIITGTVRFAPTAGFTPASSTIQTGDTVTFTNTTVGTDTTANPLTYVWDFGDGTPTSTEKNPAHPYTKAGTFTVKLTASNGLGSSSTATGTVVFKPRAAFSPATNIIHVGDSITFNNQTTGTGTITYVWDFGDGSATSTTIHPTHQYNRAGAYTVTLTATSATYGTHTATGTVLFAPTASFNPNSTPIIIQTGDTVHFANTTVGTDTPDNPMTYVWDFGDGTPASTEANPKHQYLKAGTYTAKLTASNGLGSPSAATRTVVFKPKASFSPLYKTLKLGETINFTNETTGTGAITYVWDFGDGSDTTTETNPSHKYTEVGDYTITLTATNSHGTDTITGRVSFAPVADFTPAGTPEQPIVIQLGDTIDFTNHSTGIEPVTYVWDFGDGSETTTEKNPSHTYGEVGRYTVTLTATNEYGTHTTNATVVFAPTAAFTPENSMVGLREDLAMTVTNTSTGTGPMTYLWDFGDGTTSSDETPNHFYEETGEYTITLTVTNDYGTDQYTGKVQFVPWAIKIPFLTFLPSVRQ